MVSALCIIGELGQRANVLITWEGFAYHYLYRQSQLIVVLLCIHTWTPPLGIAVSPLELYHQPLDVFCFLSHYQLAGLYPLPFSPVLIDVLALVQGGLFRVEPLMEKREGPMGPGDHFFLIQGSSRQRHPCIIFLTYTFQWPFLSHHPSFSLFLPSSICSSLTFGNSIKMS